MVKTLVEEVKEYIINLLSVKLDDRLTFHSLKHTLDVFNNSDLIGKNSGLDDRSLDLLKISALFHDVGYINKYDDHESESAKYARKFLSDKDIDESEIDIICEAILATKVPQSPKNTISEILCDADLMHLTYDNYFDQIDNMRQEWANIGRTLLDKNQFNKQSVEFFQSHKYFSEFGKTVLEPKKQKTLQKILEKIN